MNLIFYEGGGVKAHLVPAGLGLPVSQDLWNRYKAVAVETVLKQGEAFRIDLGGSMLISAEWVGVELDGTTLEVPVRDVEALYLRLLETSARSLEDGRHYYKLHGYLHCVVLTADLRTALLRAWSMKMAEYKAKAEAERSRFNAAVGGVIQGRGIMTNWRPASKVLN